MIPYLRKLVALFRLYLADVFAYRAAAVIWVLGDLQIALMMPLVWKAAGGVQGLPLAQVTTYYIVTMTISQFVACHLMWDIGFDIREGPFVNMLVRPFSVMSDSFSRNFAWRIGKLVLFVPLLVLLLPLYGLPRFGGLHFQPLFWVALLLAQYLAFLSAFCVALIALWTTEFVSLFQLYYFPELILSGRVVPLTALPVWAQNLSQVSHFRYTISFPTEILLGRLDQRLILQGLGVQVLWIVFFAALAKVLFSKGVRQYSGFGM